MVLVIWDELPKNICKMPIENHISVDNIAEIFRLIRLFSQLNPVLNMVKHIAGSSKMKQKAEAGRNLLKLLRTMESL